MSNLKAQRAVIPWRASGKDREANAFVCSADAKLRCRQRRAIYKAHTAKRLFSRVTLNVTVNKIHAFCCEGPETPLPMNGNFVMLYKYPVSFHAVKYSEIF